MNTVSQAVAILFVLAILGALGMGGYAAFDYLTEVFASLDTQLAKVTGIASVVVTLAALIVALGIRRGNKLQVAAKVYADKAEAYKIFIEFWLRVQRDRIARIEIYSVQTTNQLQRLAVVLAIHADPSIIKAHTALREQWLKHDAQSMEFRSQFIKTIAEIRKDLGTPTGELSDRLLNELLFQDDGIPTIDPSIDRTESRTATS